MANKKVCTKPTYGYADVNGEPFVGPKVQIGRVIPPRTEKSDLATADYQVTVHAF
jgi:hypothetical protein